MTTAWIITRLDKHHDRTQFACGQPSLDAFLKSLVTQYEKRRLGRTFVATEPDSARVAGFYTLAVGSIGVSSLDAAVQKKLPKHPVPTIHLGRLAVDEAYRGRRLGETLLLHAMQATFEVSQKAGVFALDVVALDDDAREFYLKYGFISLQNDPLHLYLPMKTIEARLQGE